jgi:hypothetical protein
MKRLLLALLIAAPLGCSSVPGPWMKEFDKDPDLKVDIWDEDNSPNKPVDAGKPPAMTYDRVRGGIG